MNVMRLICLGILASSVFLGHLRAQDCAAIARILPAGALTGTLSTANCRLSDGTAYAPYRLDLPVRGQIRIALTGNATDFQLILRDAAGTKLDSGAAIARPIEAGRYTVVLNGAKPGQGGDYGISTTFTGEPGMLCSNFPNLGRRQVVNGILPSSACLALDGTPYEAYTVTTDGSGTLTITVDSTDFTPMIAVRSNDGHLLAAPAASPVNILVNGDSQYFVIVTSDGKSGAYTISTTFQTAGDETCKSQKTFSDSDSDASTIGADSCFLTLAGSGDQTYYKLFWQLTVPAHGLMDVTATSGDFNATVNLLDAGGNLLASNAGGGGLDAQFNLQSSLCVPLPAGSDRLQIFSDVPSGGASRAAIHVHCRRSQAVYPGAAEFRRPGFRARSSG